MSKSPSLNVNFNLTDSEITDKITVAVEKYIEQISDQKINEYLDSTLEKYIDNRINAIFSSEANFYSYRYKDVKKKIEDKIERKVYDTVDDAIVKIIARKINNILSEAEEKNQMPLNSCDDNCAYKPQGIDLSKLPNTIKTVTCNGKAETVMVNYTDKDIG